MTIDRTELALAEAVAIAKAVATERERCAKIAEGQAEFVSGETHERLCRDIAALIRKE